MKSVAFFVLLQAKYVNWENKYYYEFTGYLAFGGGAGHGLLYRLYRQWGDGYTEDTLFRIPHGILLWTLSGPDATARLVCHQSFQ